MPPMYTHNTTIEDVVVVIGDKGFCFKLCVNGETVKPDTLFEKLKIWVVDPLSHCVCVRLLLFDGGCCVYTEKD